MVENIIYLLLSLWGAVNIYLVFEVFYDTVNISKNTKIILFGAYFLIINIVYLTINIPIVNLMVNIILFVGISLIYKIKIKKSIITSFLIYIILLSGESLSSMLMSYNKLYVIKGGIYTPLENLFFGKLFIFIIIIFLKKYSDLKKSENISNKNIGIIITIAIISIYLMVILLGIETMAFELKVIGIIGLLILNLAIIYLYSSILERLQYKFDRVAYEQELLHAENQYNTIKDFADNMQIFQHDIKNHLIVITNMIQNNELDLAIDHINALTDSNNPKVNTANSGNRIIDSIINVKIQKLDNLKIKYNFDISIPNDLQLCNKSMTAILSNALDNAIEALSKMQTENRWLNFTIKYNMNKIIISIENPYIGKIETEGKRILTMKKNKINHGIGLKSIIVAVKDVGGLLEMNYDNGIFRLDIII